MPRGLGRAGATLVSARFGAQAHVPHHLGEDPESLLNRSCRSCLLADKQAQA